jgi:hypothetical protein
MNSDGCNSKICLVEVLRHGSPSERISNASVRGFDADHQSFYAWRIRGQVTSTAQGQGEALGDVLVSVLDDTLGSICNCKAIAARKDKKPVVG